MSFNRDNPCLWVHLRPIKIYFQNNYSTIGVLQKVPKRQYPSTRSTSVTRALVILSTFVLVQKLMCVLKMFGIKDTIPFFPFYPCIPKYVQFFTLFYQHLVSTVFQTYSHPKYTGKYTGREVYVILCFDRKKKFYVYANSCVQS